MIDEFYNALKEVARDVDKYMLLFKSKERVAVIRGGKKLDVKVDGFIDYNGDYCLDIGQAERMSIFFDDYEVFSL